MKKIKLTQGYVTFVDDIDYEYLNQWKWYVRHFKNTSYAVRNIRKEDGKQTAILMHRQILNTPKGMEVDHKDHNGLNNQRYNIRDCTKSQNQINRKPVGKSRYMGVSIESKGSHKGRIRAQIRINGKVINLGFYKSEYQAALVYDDYARIYYGEFANLNFKNN